MEDTKRQFIIKNLFVTDFMEHKSHEMVLSEQDETGRSDLWVQLKGEDNLCIVNVDKKKTDILFFQAGKELSLYKRVDHMLFERKPDGRWKVHLIEMKGSVGEPKWNEIKGKFRSSYMLAKAVAGMLELDISETVMYTTYERVVFSFSETMPSARRGRPGRTLVRMQDEWEGRCFGLNLGERVPFLHIPIKMTRNASGVLTGSLAED